MKQKTGDEHITMDGMPIGRSLRDYWAWNASDLLNNTLRGSFCEFIVSDALGLDMSGVNDDWTPYDIDFPRQWTGEDGVSHDNIRIEVKSAAYLQAWEQVKPSNILFSIRPTRAWYPATGYKRDCKRQSDVYVFCLYTVKDRSQANPLELKDWVFYVISTARLNELCGPQKSLSLHMLEALNPQKTDYDGILGAVYNVCKFYPRKF